MDNFVQTPPRFPVGTPLNIGYLGLYYAAGRATNRSGREVDYGARIIGMRLTAEAVEGDEGVDLLHRSGWEYQVGFISEGLYHESGWYRETELLKYGYGDSVPVPIWGETIPT